MSKNTFKSAALLVLGCFAGFMSINCGRKGHLDLTTTVPAMVCAPNVACNTGLMGICSVGTCNATGTTCDVTVRPGSQSEVCDNVDNNCDGQINEGNVCHYACTDDPMVGKPCASNGVYKCRADMQALYCALPN